MYSFILRKESGLEWWWFVICLHRFAIKDTVRRFENHAPFQRQTKFESFKIKKKKESDVMGCHMSVKVSIKWMSLSRFEIWNKCLTTTNSQQQHRRNTYTNKVRSLAKSRHLRNLMALRSTSESSRYTQVSSAGAQTRFTRNKLEFNYMLT